MQIIKTALLSYGMSGKIFHAPFLAIHPGFELVGAWERTKNNIQHDYTNTKTYATLEALLSDAIDLVIVNTPVHTHFEYAKKALLAGKHIVVEKAFTTTVAEAKEIIELAKAKNLKVAVFQNRRWDSDFKTVKQIFEQMVLGEIVEAEFHFDRFNPILSSKSHKEINNGGAGILKDLGPHLIDQALHLFGYPKSVFATIRTTREHSLVDDWFDLLLLYDNLTVRLKSGFFVRETIPSYQLHGKKGSFLKTRGDVQEEHLTLATKPNINNWGKEDVANRGILHTEIKDVVKRKKIPTLQGNYYDFFELLYQAIHNNTSEPVTAEDGLRVMQIIEAAIKSNSDKKVIDL